MGAEGISGAGAGGGGGDRGPDAHQFPLPLPGMLPDIAPCAAPPAGSILHNFMTWSALTSPEAHGQLRDDMCEHTWRERGELLEPYL